MSGSRDLWAAYQRTHVDVRLSWNKRITVCSAPTTAQPNRFPFPPGSYAYILTACNPESRPLPEAENLERHRALGRQLQQMSHPTYPTVGHDPTDPSWAEPGYAIVGLSDQTAFRLAREWEQNALFVWDAQRWILASVLLAPRRTVTGWTLV